MKTLILLRGLPGAGKSTLAQSITNSIEGGIYIEADKFFIDRDTGRYRFDASRLKEAHAWCQNTVKEFISLKHNKDITTIVISNTFTEEWEIEPYYELSKKYRCRIYSLIVENRHGGESIHAVPKETIEKMRNRFQIQL